MQALDDIRGSIRPGNIYGVHGWRVIRGPDGRLAAVSGPPTDRPVVYEAFSREDAFEWIRRAEEAHEAKVTFLHSLAWMLVITLLAWTVLESDEASAAETTLNWQAPTQNVDGSPLTDLAGYLVYFGSSSRSYLGNVAIQDPAATSATVSFAADWLVPGENRIFIAMTALDDDGNESPYSNEISRLVTVTDDVAPGSPIIITITIEIGVDCPVGVTCTVGGAP